MKEAFLKNIENANIEAVKQNLNDPNFSKDYLKQIYLHVIITKNPELATLLINNGADISQWVHLQRAPYEQVPLLIYAIQNKLDSVAEALIKRPDLNINRQFKDESFLAYVIKHGGEKATNALLSQGLDLATAFSEAAFAGNIKLVQKIMSHPNFNESYIKGVRVDDKLIKNSPEAAVLLINNGADISNYDGFRYAIQKKLDAPINALLNQKDLKVDSLLSAAIDTNSVELVQKILRHPNFNESHAKGVRVNDNLIKNSPEIAVLLINNGANISEHWALSYATIKSHNVIEALVKRPDLDINKHSSFRSNVIRLGNEKAISALLGRQDLDLSSTLHDAVYSGNIELVQKILSHPNFNENHAKGVRVGNDLIKKSPEIAVLLINNGAGIWNYTFNNEVLAYAIESKLDGVVEALLKRPDLNINLQVGDKLLRFGGEPPLNCAFRLGNEKAINSIFARQDLDLAPALLKAAFDGNIQLVQKILSHPSFNESHVKTVHLSYCIKNSPEIAALLINNGADILSAIVEGKNPYDDYYSSYRSQTQKGIPLVNYAIDNKLDSVVEALVKRPDLDINQRVQIGQSFMFEPLASYVIRNGNETAINALLKRPDLDVNVQIDNQPLLVYAMNANNNALVERILTSDNFMPNNTLNVAALRGTPELVQRILDHKNFKDVVLTDQECALLMKYKIDNPQIQLREEHYRQLLAHGTDSLSQVMTFLEAEKFAPVARFTNGDSVLHVLAGRADFDKNTSAVMGKLLALKDQESNPAINVNARNNNGDRAIDLARQNKDIVSPLREHGSVEPKNQITAKTQQLEKIIFDTNRAPDGIDGNNKKTVAILSKMYKDYPLTEEQINQEIENLKKPINQEIEDSKKKHDLTIYKAEWGGEVDTVPKVIDALCEMRNVHDRLADSWDFKKVLGTAIHVAKTGEDSTHRLIDGLSQIRLCNLSKLMNMLGTVQDKIVEVKGIDYSKKTLMDFSEMLEGTLIKVNETYNEKAPLALAKWVNDLTNRREVDDPDKWSGYSQVIRGVMNSQMSKVEGVDFASSNYNDGLQTVIIPNLQEFLDPSNIQTKSTNPTIAKWQKQVEEGRTMMAIEVFDKIVQDKANLGILEEASWNYDLSLGVQVAMPAKVIEEYAGKVEARHGAEVAKAFVNSLKDNLELNDEAKKYLESYKAKEQEQNKDLESQAMSLAPQIAKASNQSTSPREAGGRSESYAEREIQRRLSSSNSSSIERS